MKSDKTFQFFVLASCIWYKFYSKKYQFTLHKWCRHLFVCLQTCLGRRPIWRWWHHKIWDTTFSNGIRCRLCWYWIEGSFVWTIKSVMPLNCLDIWNLKLCKWVQNYMYNIPWLSCHLGTSTVCTTTNQVGCPHRGVKYAPVNTLCIHSLAEKLFHWL